MIDTAATFVTDRGYLVPSLVAAHQLKSFGIDKIADLLIYLIDDDTDLVRRVMQDFGSEFHIIPFQDTDYTRGDLSGFYANHVPVTALARMAIGDTLDVTYRNLVYLDGDVQVLADPSPLFSKPVPDGKIVAAPDGDWIRTKAGRPPYEHLDAHGLEAETYFNSGVFAVSTETWRDRGPKALRLFLEDPPAYKLHDQTVLNLVFAGDVLDLSPLYNFHEMCVRAGAWRDVSPKIVHFTGPLKPWSHFPPPWYGRFRKDYVQLVQRYPYLAQTLTLSKQRGLRELNARLRTLKHQYHPKNRESIRIGRQTVLDRIAQGAFIS